MRVIVSGGCGFIGSNLVSDLITYGHQILILDKITYAANTNGLEHPDIELIKVDISEINLEVKERLKKFNPQVFLHLSAESMVDRALNNNKVFFDTNVMGTWVTLELIKELQIEKAIFFSTDEVYGSLQLETYQIDNYMYGFKETDILLPRNPYAGSKAAADEITLSYINSFQLPICIVRPTNNFGPRQNEEKLIPKTITNILKNKKVPIYGSGTGFYREWMYVKDTCTAISTILEKGTLGSIYNIGTGIRHSNMEVMESICNIMGVEVKEVVEHIKDPRGRSHDTAYAVDSSSIRQLGWIPTTNLEDGLRMTIDYYRNNFKI